MDEGEDKMKGETERRRGKCDGCWRKGGKEDVSRVMVEGRSSYDKRI